MRQFVHEFTKFDVGKHYVRGTDGRTVFLKNIMGHVQKIDIGKRLYKVGSIYQVENNEQLKERTK